MIGMRPFIDLAGPAADRTPVFVAPDRLDAWLDSAVTDSERARQLLREASPPELAVRAASRTLDGAARACSRQRRTFAKGGQGISVSGR
ncbi:MAG: hypothetical protein DLM56_05990 [Pseudonocardiales bacterium]|nr:MAG: hypothetical protein DLM56_05990 [Pseudonocardiales bacterium]